MESDFDTGEPVGLETLVAKRMIVPTERPKTGVIGSAVGAVASVIPDSLKLTKAPTSSRPELDHLIKHYADLNGLPSNWCTGSSNAKATTIRAPTARAIMG